MNILLITTTIFSEKALGDLARLFGSIEQSEDFNVEMMLLVQGVEGELSLQVPNFVNLMVEKEIVSLSKARNIMLQALRKGSKRIEDYDVVAFPDDDCWYPEGNLEKICRYMKDHQCDYFVTKYRFEGHSSLGDREPYNPGLFKLLQNSSSITIFVSGSVFSKIGFFDERVGVGAQFLGGEDLDYSIRAYKESNNHLFADDYLMAHPDKNSRNKERYYEGSLFVLNKHCFSSLILFFMLIRKVLVGFYYVGSGKFGVAKLLSVFGRVFGECWLVLIAGVPSIIRVALSRLTTAFIMLYLALYF